MQIDGTDYNLRIQIFKAHGLSEEHYQEVKNLFLVIAAPADLDSDGSDSQIPNWDSDFNLGHNQGEKNKRRATTLLFGQLWHPSCSEVTTNTCCKSEQVSLNIHIH